MSEYYQRNLEYVKRAMTVMELKKRSKSELVELASAIGTQTMGTKQSLITTMAMKITSMLLQNGPESEQLSPACSKYSVEEYMMLPTLRIMPQNSKEFLRQVIRNYKRELRESVPTPAATTEHPIGSSKPLMSFNPTFQNYNFIPFFQSNMNFNGANNYLGQMMGHPQVIPTPMNPYVGQVGQLPYQLVGTPSVSLADSSVSQYSYPTMLFNGGLQMRQPQLMPMVPANSLQVSSVSTVDPRMVMSNPSMNPLLSFNQTRMSQPASSTPEPAKKPVQTTQPVSAPSKRPIPPFTSTSTPPPKRDWRNQKNSEQRPLIGCGESKCICSPMPQMMELRLGNRITCQSCGSTFHESCLSMTTAQQCDKDIFECFSCTMRSMNPLVEVITVVKEETINFDQYRDRSYTVTVKLDRKQLDQQHFVDIRMVKLDGQNQYDMTWPDQAIVRIGEELVQEIRPLQYLSSVKKRKDSSITIDAAALKKHNYAFTLRIEVKPISKDQQKNYKVNEGSVFALGIYVANNVPVDILVKQSRRRQLSSCRKFIEDIIARASTEDVECEKLSINLNDPYNLEKIQLPARGNYCQHAQCFDLDTFCLMMSSILYPSWRCPVCKKRCFNLYVDTYMLSILQEAKAAGDLAQEVSFDTTGGYKFTKSVEFIDLDADVPPAQPTQQAPPQSNQ